MLMALISEHTGGLKIAKSYTSTGSGCFQGLRVGNESKLPFDLRDRIVSQHSHMTSFKKRRCYLHCLFVCSVCPACVARVTNGCCLLSSLPGLPSILFPTMSAAIPPGGTWFDTIKRSFADVPIDATNDDGISTSEFLEAAESLTTLFGECS